MAQDSVRDIRNSIRARVSSLLTAPPSGSGVTAYTVYNEVDLRSAQAGTLTRSYPSVFLVDTGIRPAKTALPMVAIETIISSSPFELGNDDGISFECGLHCFGRQSNEASLLAYHILKNFRPLSVYDYSDADSPTLREVASVNPKIEVVKGPALGDEERQQGAYEYWYIVVVRGMIRDNQ